VISDVGEVKAIHRIPEVRLERAGHAPKLAGPLIVIARASRARIRLVRRRSQRKERLRSLLLTTAGARFPTLAIKRPHHKRSEGAVIPLRQRGPPIDQHPPRSMPLTRPSQRREIDWIPPTAGLSPSDPPHIS
jgi:hypothetical protein